MKNFQGGFFMDKIETKFPSIWNSKCKKEIDIKLYNQTPDTQIARWLEQNAKCKEDCISASTIRRYRLYVNEHGGFEQLINPEDIDYDDITFEELDQHAMNLMYHRLADLEGGNFVQACATIFKHSRPTNVNVNADVDAEMRTSLLQKLERPLPELDEND